MHTLSFP